MFENMEYRGLQAMTFLEAGASPCGLPVREGPAPVAHAGVPQGTGCRLSMSVFSAMSMAALLMAATAWSIGHAGSQKTSLSAASQAAISLSENSDLPEGWVARTDSFGQTFYHHILSGKTQWVKPAREEWKRPAAWVPAYQKHRLPTGWTAKKDRHDRAYYVNEDTGERQWERPEFSPVAASTCVYTRHASYAIPGNNVEVAEGQTANTCKELCTSKPDCLSVEFATIRSAGGVAAYPPGWCSLQSAGTGGQKAAPGYMNLDLYVKGDCAAEKAAPGSAVHAKVSPPQALQHAEALAQAQACSPPQVKDITGSCVAPTEPSLMTFYMYRSQSDEEYPLENVNMADLAGALWYLHREVVSSVPRKFKITRILRYMVTMKNTRELWRRTKRQFGPFVAFDDGSAIGRSKMWEDYGFVLGCQFVDTALYNYRGDKQAGKWFSLPGPCPEERVADKTPHCMQQFPGGNCQSAMVTGARDCTYYTEFAGQLRLDDIEGIRNYSTWWLGHTKEGGIVPNGNKEYDPRTDRGVGMTFWNGRHNATSCTQRMDWIEDLFKKKYPDLPRSLSEPPCDAR